MKYNDLKNIYKSFPLCLGSCFTSNDKITQLPFYKFFCSVLWDTYKVWDCVIGYKLLFYIFYQKKHWLKWQIQIAVKAKLKNKCARAAAKRRAVFFIKCRRQICIKNTLLPKNRDRLRSRTNVAINSKVESPK